MFGLNRRYFTKSRRLILLAGQSLPGFPGMTRTKETITRKTTITTRWNCPEVVSANAPRHPISSPFLRRSYPAWGSMSPPNYCQIPKTGPAASDRNQRQQTGFMKIPGTCPRGITLLPLACQFRKVVYWRSYIGARILALVFWRKVP